MNLLHAFAPSFDGHADNTGLEFGDQTFSFRQIDQRSNQIVYLLQSRGFTDGDRLAVYLENCPEFIFLFLASAKLGVIFVPVNILYKEREVSHILNDASPKAVIAQGEVPGHGSTWLLADLNREADKFPKTAFQSATNGDSTAAIVYTSGTTGASKGAMLTHNNFIANGINLVTAWQINEGERFLLALPLFHVHALGNGVMIWLMTGCRMRLLERFEHQKAPTEFVAFKPTLFFGVPTIYIRLLDQDVSLARQIGASLRLFVCGSAPLPAQVLDAFREKYGHTILERYGMTETLMNISNPYYGTRKAGTVGLPLPGISAKVMNDDGPAAIGSIGEVYIKGPNVFSGYWNRADATQQAFKDGYFKTGDLGFIDTDGYFTLCGRKSDLIISGGFNIYPREIEEFLLEQPGIAEAAVVGVAHPVRGEVPVAYLVLSSASLDIAVLEATCRNHLASFKIPRAFVTVEKLPRTALGKVQKHLLPSPYFKEV